MDEIIIQTNDEKVFVIVLENGRIVEYYEYFLNNLSKIGNIYIGVVKDVLPKSNTIFVGFGDEKTGYLQLDELDKNYKNGDRIIVQVKKDAYDNKGAKLTNRLSISGKYTVLLANSSNYTVSHKLEYSDFEEIFNKIKEILPSQMGAIIRTEAENAESNDIYNEITSLYKEYLELENKLKIGELGIIYEASKIENKILLDFVKKSTKKIYINDKNIYENILNKIASFKANNSNYYCFPEIEYSECDFIQKFGLVSELEKIFDRKIWLKSSGYIVIDKTEALVAIDVNTGKNLGNADSNKEDIAYKTNFEAAIESMRQIRLKNLGGIIIIDFINMEKDGNKEAILDILKAESKKDRSKVEILGFTKLGLVEMTRKKI